MEKLRLNLTECLITSVAEITKRLVEAEGDHPPTTGEDERQRIEVFVAGPMGKNSRLPPAFVLPELASRPIEHDGMSVQARNDLLFDVRLPIGAVGADEQDEAAVPPVRIPEPEPEQASPRELPECHDGKENEHDRQQDHGGEKRAQAQECMVHAVIAHNRPDVR